MTAVMAHESFHRDARSGHASMRAHVIQAPFGVDALALVERPIPMPGARDVVVRMRAIALNYRDVLIVTGAWKAREPRVPVSDGVGEVVAVGAEVTRVAVGDRVAGTFYPHWHDGEATPETLRAPLGGVAADGVLAEYVRFDEGSPERWTAAGVSIGMGALLKMYTLLYMLLLIVLLSGVVSLGLTLYKHFSA